ncbi:MAG: putative metal-binding motif-containing protein [Deltaproteobacteria bacterium]|nr:putative metal-binding motif-containing protein [Deltaproteobacteria bacterium]
MRRSVFFVLVSGMAACSPGATKDSAAPVDSGFNLDTDLNPEGGIFDPTKDNDGDGYLFADDCDDRNPEVNPGAFDLPGDAIDNDCNGKVDDADDCQDASLKLESWNPYEFAQALGLCRFTKGDATGKAKTWGVLDAKLVRADGIGAPERVQYGIMSKLGGWVTPREGANFVVLSSGTARPPSHADWVAPRDPSFITSSVVVPPAGWPRNTAGCPAPFDKTANDSVNLRLTIRVPTNAKAFSFDFDFYSSEYITYACSAYNDTFVAILQTSVAMNPSFGGNVAVDGLGNPINVNSGFFEVCSPGTAASGTKYPCPKGITELQGTGFWNDASPQDHGATSWLQSKAPVAPGETITIQFMIWDTGDHALDSSVLIDNWKWDVKPTTGPDTARPR